MGPVIPSWHPVGFLSSLKAQEKVAQSMYLDNISYNQEPPWFTYLTVAQNPSIPMFYDPQQTQC